MRHTVDQARAAKSKLRSALETIDNVNGIGLAQSGGDFVLQIYVAQDRDLDRLPKQVDGMEVEVQVVGTIAAD